MFDVAPHIFIQLYVIRAPLDSGSVSCVYALLSDKSEATYQQLITAVVDHCDELGFQPDPTTIITDFEMAQRSNIPEGLGQLVKYFDQTYVSGSFQGVQLSPAADGTVQPIRMRRIFPLNIPTIWNVHDMTVSGGSRTNNMCEAWNRGFSTLVGHAHLRYGHLFKPYVRTFLLWREPSASNSYVNIQGTMRLN